MSLWGVTAVLVVAAVAWWLRSKPPDEIRSVASIERPIGFVMPQAQPVVIQDAAASDVRSPSAAKDAPQAPNEPRDIRGRLRQLIARFSAEPAGTEAGVELRAKILASISAQQGLALTSVDVECRENVCRIELTGPKPDQQRALDAIVDLDLFERFTPMTEVREGEVRVTRAYLAGKD